MTWDQFHDLDPRRGDPFVLAQSITVGNGHHDWTVPSGTEVVYLSWSESHGIEILIDDEDYDVYVNVSDVEVKA